MMNLLKFALVICLTSNSIAQIGIGTNNPHPSSILDVESSSKGFLLPRLTSDQREAISNPAEGLTIYNTDYKCIEFKTSNYWLNPCCVKTVEEGITTIPAQIFFNLNNPNSIIKINSTDGTSTGTPANPDEFVYSYNSVINNETKLLEYSGGVLESDQPELFQYKVEDNNSLPPYKKNRSIYRNKKRDIPGIQTGPSLVSSLKYDFSPDYNGEFEIVLIAKMDPDPDNIIQYTSFFSSADAVNNNSLQLGLGSTNPLYNLDAISGIHCEENYFRLSYKAGSVGRNICGATVENKVLATDDRFHVFNVIQKDHPNGVNKILELYIDGEFVQKDEGLTQYLIFENLKLFSNRNGGKAAKSYISELLFFNTPLNDLEKNIVDSYFLCKYGK